MKFKWDTQSNNKIKIVIIIKMIIKKINKKDWNLLLMA